jgi:hypothetical protein
MLGRVELARRMWSLYEPVHAVIYFTPEARARFEAAGLRGFWRGYFAGRAAPLGPVDAAPVVAAFFNFAPAMVARAVPDVWQRAAPADALRARSAAATTALARLTAGLPAAEVAEAADRLTEAAGRLECAGRVLGAANAALPVPGDPLARLWQAATTLREHRGDGHVAALVAAGLTGCEVLVWRAATDLTRDLLQPARGWTDEEWDAAEERLRARGWLDRTLRATDAGTAGYRAIEAATDRACAHAWTHTDTGRLRTLLTPLATACYHQLPALNPIGLPAPGANDEGEAGPPR